MGIDFRRYNLKPTVDPHTARVKTLKTRYKLKLYFAEFLQSALQQDVCRKQWLEVQDEFEGLNKRISHLYNEKTTLETKLKHAR